MDVPSLIKLIIIGRITGAFGGLLGLCGGLILILVAIKKFLSK